MKKYIVLDQNIMRKHSLEVVIANEPETHFVLPDVAFIEMTKSVNWEQTLKRSLNQLAYVPNRVHVAHSVSQALATEMSDLRPVTKHMLYGDAGNFAREILLWVRSGTETAAVSSIRADPDGHKAALAGDHLDHEENRFTYKELIEATKRFIPEEAQKMLRCGKLGAEDQLTGVHQIATGLLPKILAERGVSNGKACSFMKTRPMMFRYLLVKAWYCVRWISKGGFESLGGPTATNELMDQHYVLTASFFDGLLSEERRVNDSYRDLVWLLQRHV